MSPPPPAAAKASADRKSPQSSSSLSESHHTNNTSDVLEAFLSNSHAKQAKTRQCEKEGSKKKLADLPPKPSVGRTSEDNHQQLHQRSEKQQKNLDSLSSSNHTATTSSTMTSMLSPIPHSNSSLTSNSQSLSRWDSSSPVRLNKSPTLQRQQQRHQSQQNLRTPTARSALSSEALLPIIASSSNSSSEEKSDNGRLPTQRGQKGDPKVAEVSSNAVPPEPPVASAFSPAMSTSSASSGTTGPGNIQTIIRRKTVKKSSKAVTAGAATATSSSSSSAESPDRNMSFHDYRNSLKTTGSRKSDNREKPSDNNKEKEKKAKKKTKKVPPSTSSSTSRTASAVGAAAEEASHQMQEDSYPEPRRRTAISRSRSSGSNGPIAKRVDTKDSPPELTNRKAIASTISSKSSKSRMSASSSQEAKTPATPEQCSSGGHTPNVIHREGTSGGSPHEFKSRKSVVSSKTRRSRAARQEHPRTPGAPERRLSEGRTPKATNRKTTDSKRKQRISVGSSLSRSPSSNHYRASNSKSTPRAEQSGSSLTRSRSLPLGGALPFAAAVPSPASSPVETNIDGNTRPRRRNSNGSMAEETISSGNDQQAGCYSSLTTRRTPRRAISSSTPATTPSRSGRGVSARGSSMEASTSTTASIMERLSFAAFRYSYRASHHSSTSAPSAGGTTASPPVARGGNDLGRGLTAAAGLRSLSRSLAASSSSAHLTAPSSDRIGETMTPASATTGTGRSQIRQQQQHTAPRPTNIPEAVAALRRGHGGGARSGDGDGSSRTSRSTTSRGTSGRTSLSSYRETAGSLELPISSSPVSSPLLSPSSRRMLADLELSPSNTSESANEGDDDDDNMSLGSDHDHMDTH